MIIIARSPEYGRPYTGEKWSPNFWTFPRAYKVKWMSNNGNLKCISKDGKLRWFNFQEVKVVKR